MELPNALWGLTWKQRRKINDMNGTKSIPATATSRWKRRSVMAEGRIRLRGLCCRTFGRKYPVYTFVYASKTIISTCHVFYLGSLVRTIHKLIFFYYWKVPVADPTDTPQPWMLIVQPYEEDDIFLLFHFNGALVEWNWQGKTEVLGEKPVPVPLCPP
jgi:hypothetical protein